MGEEIIAPIPAPTKLAVFSNSRTPPEPTYEIFEKNLMAKAVSHSVWPALVSAKRERRPGERALLAPGV
jgi:murein L,D-transpeptidase YcbB/YkuD